LDELEEIFAMKIFMIPKNHEYINKLTRGLERIGVEVMLLKPFHYSSMTNLFKLIRYGGRGYNLIHVHWLYIFPHRLVMKLFTRLTRLLGVKVVWEVHNILPHGWREIDRKISREFLENADGLILHSRQDLERIRESLGVDPGQPYIVVPHGNFIGSYRNDIGREAARNRLQIDPGENVLLCFGFIRKNRGYECLLDAMERVGNIALVIAGRIEDKDVYQEIVRRAKDNPKVRLFTGWIPDDDIQVYFNACDVVVLPYTEITTSGVVPLAYSFGKPVITTSIGGMTEIVSEETGKLVPPGDSDRLALAIREIFGEDYEKKGKFAYRFAEENLSWDRNIEAMVGLYGLVCNSRGTAKGRKQEQNTSH
jgi:beta-1,4-mannosyltransferase